MRNERRFSLALIAGDFASVVLAFNLVAIARGIITADTPFFWALLIPAFFVFVATALTDGYSPRTDFLSLDYASQHLLAQSAAALATLVVTYVVFTEGLFLQTSRLVTVFSFLIIAQATLGLRRVLCLRRVARRANHATIFVGDAGSAKAFSEECERARFQRPLILA